MATRRPRVERFKNLLAFLVSIAIGVACGYLFSAADAIEDRLNSRTRTSTKQTGKSG